MASRLSRSLLRTPKVRLYSAQAAAQQESVTSYIPPEAPAVSKVKNIKCVSVETYSPLSRVGIVVRAGPRYEAPEDQGLSHCLRHSGMLSNKSMTAFKLTKLIHQTGGNLSISSSREYMYYICEATRQNVDKCISYLVDIVGRPDIRPWEYAEVSQKLNMDHAILSVQPNIKVIELLHEAAYGDTLGQSLYCPVNSTSQYGPKQVKDYMAKHYAASNIGIVGMGCDHFLVTGEAEELAGLVGSNTAPAAPKPVHYRGGQSRLIAPGPITYAAVATEGPSMASKDVLAAGVLQMIMGTGSHMKYSQGLSSSRLSQAVAKAVDSPFSIQGLNVNYTESGLFGFVAAAHPGAMDKVMKAAFNQFAEVTKVGVSDQELARGKNQLKTHIVMSQETGEGQFMDLIEQVMGSDRLLSSTDVCKMVDSISKDDVVAEAKKLVAGKPSMAAVGDLSKTPYLDELYK